MFACCYVFFRSAERQHISQLPSYKPNQTRLSFGLKLNTFFQAKFELVHDIVVCTVKYVRDGVIFLFLLFILYDDNRCE